MINKTFRTIVCSFLILVMTSQNVFAFSGNMGMWVAEMVALKAQERVSGAAVAGLTGGAMALSVSEQTPTSAYAWTLKAAEVAVVTLATASAGYFGAPAWVALAVAATVEVAYKVGSDYYTKHADGTVTVSGPASGPALQVGGPYWQGCSGGVFYADAASCNQSTFEASQYYPLQDGWTYSYNSEGNGGVFHCVNNSSGPYACFFAQLVSSGAPATCLPGQSYLNGSCVGTGTGGGSVVTTPAQKIASLTEPELNAPADPALLADIGNEIWKEAAKKPGTIPFDSQNPITKADVEQYQREKPESYPKTRDVVESPFSPSGTVSIPSPAVKPATVTSTSTATTTNTGTGTTTITNTTIDLGPDPGIDFKNPEAPGTQTLLNPFFNLLPGFRDYHAPTRSVGCPVYKLELWGREFYMTTQCDLIEAARPQIQAISSVVWTLVGIIIVLGA